MPSAFEDQIESLSSDKTLSSFGSIVSHSLLLINTCPLPRVQSQLQTLRQSLPDSSIKISRRQQLALRIYEGAAD